MTLLCHNNGLPVLGASGCMLERVISFLKRDELGLLEGSRNSTLSSPGYPLLVLTENDYNGQCLKLNQTFFGWILLLYLGC